MYKDRKLHIKSLRGNAGVGVRALSFIKDMQVSKYVCECM